MTKEEFLSFVNENKKELPLFFQSFEFKTKNDASNYKLLTKSVKSTFYNTDKYQIEKFHKDIYRF